MSVNQMAEISDRANPVKRSYGILVIFSQKSVVLESSSSGEQKIRAQLQLGLYPDSLVLVGCYLGQVLLLG